MKPLTIKPLAICPWNYDLKACVTCVECPNPDQQPCGDICYNPTSQKCCPDATIVGKDACCPGEQQCPEGCFPEDSCCPEQKRCNGACIPRKDCCDPPTSRRLGEPLEADFMRSVGLQRKLVEDPCCTDPDDPCCGSDDACCGSDDPCCGNDDPCCVSPLILNRNREHASFYCLYNSYRVLSLAIHRAVPTLAVAVPVHAAETLGAVVSRRRKFSAYCNVLYYRAHA